MPRPLKETYGDQKPPFSYISLTAMAIWSSPNRMLPLCEIYKYIMDNFPYYRKNTHKWQNSLRHNLSFNDCFFKIPRTTNRGGKGSYWALHPKAIDMFANGSFLRRRKRFRVHKIEKDILKEEIAAYTNFNRYVVAQQQHPAVNTWNYPQIPVTGYPHPPLYMHNSPELDLVISSPEPSISPSLPSPPSLPPMPAAVVNKPKRPFDIESLIGPDSLRENTRPVNMVQTTSAPTSLPSASTSISPPMMNIQQLSHSTYTSNLAMHTTSSLPMMSAIPMYNPFQHTIHPGMHHQFPMQYPHHPCLPQHAQQHQLAAATAALLSDPQCRYRGYPGPLTVF